MKTAELKATIRENIGAKNAKGLRKDNMVPAVVYGANGVKHIAVDYLPLAKLVNSPDLYLITLDADGEHRRVIVQDTQYHPITDHITHVDFLEAAVGKTAKLKVPVHITGSSVGVLAGGQLVVKARYLNVKGVPAELPESIDVDITNLQIGKSIKVADIKGYDFLDSPNSVIVRVKTARNIEDLLAAEAEAAGEGEEGEEAAEGAEGAEGETPAEGSEAAAPEEKSE